MHDFQWLDSKNVHTSYQKAGENQVFSLKTGIWAESKKGCFLREGAFMW